MTDPVDPAASDVSEQTEPESKATEQTTESLGTSFQDVLLRAAVEDGHELGNVPPKAETEPEPEAEPKETEPAETESETETKTETEVQPAAKKDDVWPESAKKRVAEEAEKRRRAIERADKAEQLAQQYQAQLAQTVAPQPTEDNPFLDVQDINKLDALQQSYEKTIDLADENPEGAVDVVIGRDSSGREVRKDFTPEELAHLRKKADKAIRKFIPEHRTYLQQRAVADQQALEIYPELRDPDSEFTKAASILANGLLTGRALKDPNLLVWIGHAVKGYQDSLKRNGHETKVSTPAAKRIVESARTQVAPTPTRTRQFVERGTSSSKTLEKAAERLEKTGSAEDAEALVGALLSQRSSGPKRLEPITE
jgi:hypothetical protein